MLEQNGDVVHGTSTRNKNITVKKKQTSKGKLTLIPEPELRDFEGIPLLVGGFNPSEKY